MYDFSITNSYPNYAVNFYLKHKDDADYYSELSTFVVNSSNIDIYLKLKEYIEYWNSHQDTLYVELHEGIFCKIKDICSFTIKNSTLYIDIVYDVKNYKSSRELCKCRTHIDKIISFDE